MKPAKTSRNRKSATRQITKKKSVRKQQKRHHSRKRTKTQRHRKQRGGNYNIPTDGTVEGFPLTKSKAVVTTPDGKTQSVEEYINPQSIEEKLGISYPDI